MHSDKQTNIQKLSSQNRYGYFIRKVADTEAVWLIHENGQYVTLGETNEQLCIPVWPEKEFAEMMLADNWKEFAVQSMEVHEFIDWLDRLEEEGYKIAGFPTSNLQAVIVSAEEMKNHLLFELQQYE